jgi:hypothetical protein
METTAPINVKYLSRCHVLCFCDHYESDPTSIHITLCYDAGQCLLWNHQKASSTLPMFIFQRKNETTLTDLHTVWYKQLNFFGGFLGTASKGCETKPNVLNDLLFIDNDWIQMRTRMLTLRHINGTHWIMIIIYLLWYEFKERTPVY